VEALKASRQRFRTIQADPPWKFETWSEKGKGRSAERHYPSMSDDDIKALPVAELAAEDCILFLWTTGPKLPAALDVIKAWGFKYQTIGFNWAKETPTRAKLFMGIGH
jgi:N6-adenosine-specific RNA methylase IME4